MTAEWRVVDADELRRHMKDHMAVGGDEWLKGFHTCREAMLSILDAMPAVECPRGWTRDEVLAELDADPDAVCEYLNLVWNDWRPMHRSVLKDWKDPDVPRPNVRVVRVAPEPEWVPLTQLVGRTIEGEVDPVLAPPMWTVIGDRAEWRWLDAEHDYRPFPEGTLNLETGQVAVRPKAAT